MIDHFIISGEGKIGRHVAAAAEIMGLNSVATSHRLTGFRNGTFYLDLLQPFVHQENGPRPLPDAQIVYLIAGIASFPGCEMNLDSWRTNVDGPIAIARDYSERGAFVVYVSSDAVEWAGGTALGQQKRQVESYMNTIDAAIVRPTKIEKPRDLETFAQAVIKTGLSRKRGVVRWRPE